MTDERQELPLRVGLDARPPVRIPLTALGIEGLEVSSGLASEPHEFLQRLGRRRIMRFDVESAYAADAEPRGEDDRGAHVEPDMRFLRHGGMRCEFRGLERVGQHKRRVGHDRARADRVIARRRVKIDADAREEPLMIRFHDRHHGCRTVEQVPHAFRDLLEDRIAPSHDSDNLPHFPQAGMLVRSKGKFHRWLTHGAVLSHGNRGF